ncbi:MAG: peroxiredoxin [Rhodocyclaceae bacterium]|nr:peroxiredoxin [Rhodocyclaceae bacterium]
MNKIASLVVTAILSVSGFARADAAPPPGSFAPGFSLPDQNGKTRHFAEWRGQWLVLYFYPKDDTPGCTTEANAFKNDLAKFAALKTQIVGVSLDSVASHKDFAAKHQLNFPLLADVDAAVSKQYGALSDFGVFRYAKRHTFLIDPEGRVARSYLKVDADRHSAELLADLKALSKP